MPQQVKLDLGNVSMRSLKYKINKWIDQKLREFNDERESAIKDKEDRLKALEQSASGPLLNRIGK